MRRALPVAVLVLAFGVPLWVGYTVGSPFTEQGTQPGLHHTILSPSNCRGCHANFDPQIEPWSQWAGTMMAQASRDPLFWAALDVANHDVPGIGDWCLRCHVPQGWLGGRSEPPGGTVDGCSMRGLLDRLGTSTAPSDFEGVSCHLCHRMMVNTDPPPGQQPVYLENGQYWIDDESCPGGNEPCRRGPYDYNATFGNPPPHVWAYSEYHTQSDLCGNCHNVTNPVTTLIDESGTDTGIPYPVERTHREWQQSAYAGSGPEAATCQNCHMPDATESPAYACSFLSNDHAGDMPIHRFAGGNAWVPEVLRLEYPALNLDTQLAATRDAALDMLRNHSATVEVTAPGAVEPGGELEVDVRVTNLTGHKLPTGYPEGRRMWLHVEARGADDQTIWESGAYDAATGVLTHDPQIKIYHAEPGIWDHNGKGRCDTADGVGSAMFHFALNDCIAVDNRIPPLGFTGGNDPETRPVGYTYPETSPGSGQLVNWDVTRYAIPIPPATPSPVTVTATLYYQTTSKEYVEFLLAEANEHAFPNDCIRRTTGGETRTRAQILFDMWNEHGKAAPVDMDASSATSTVALPTPGEAADLRVTGLDPLTGEVTLSWQPACGATDHTLYVGNLDTLSSAYGYAAQHCGLGSSGSAVVQPGSGNTYWIVVGHDGSVEGSYGRDGAGVERPDDAALATCPLPQDLAGRCDTR